MSRNWRDVLGVKRSWREPKAVVWDNGGETVDRYTILDIYTGDMWGASTNPFSPQGFGQYVGDFESLSQSSDYYGSSIADYIKYVNKSGHLGKRVEDLTTLPEAVQKYIQQVIA